MQYPKRKTTNVIITVKKWYGKRTILLKIKQATLSDLSEMERQGGSPTFWIEKLVEW